MDIKKQHEESNSRIETGDFTAYKGSLLVKEQFVMRPERREA